MRRIACWTLASLPLLAACGDGSKAPTPAPAPEKPAAAEPETPKPSEHDMDTEYKALMARPEDSVDSIEIQHCLIGFQGAPRLRNVTRTKEEAKVLAQKVYDEALAGGDFLALIKQHTNDSAPGIYPMTQASRAGMVPSFSNVGWRLKVGEIGVAIWEEKASPFGWHIIKRLK